MNQITIKIAELSDYKTVAPFVFAKARAELAKKGFVLYACEGETPCGAIGAVEKNGVFHVVSLFVAKEYRRRGIASRLMEELEKQAESLGFPGILVSYACTAETAPQLDRFFTENEYLTPEAGSTMFTVSLEEIENSAFAGMLPKINVSEKNIVPIRGLSKALLANMQENSPVFLSLTQAEGKPLSDLCLAYVMGNQVSAFLTMTDTNGVLHLHSAYLSDKSCAPHLMALLKTAFETIKKKYPQFQKMTVTGGSESGHALIEKLLSGTDLQQITVYTTEKEFFVHELPYLPASFSAAMVRFQALTDALAEKGIGSRMTILYGAMPYVEIPLEGNDTMMGLHYDITGTDGFESFTLIAESILSVAETNRRNHILEQINAGSEPYYALLSDKGEILLRSTLDEGNDTQGLDTENTIDAFILPFRQYAEQLYKRLH